MSGYIALHRTIGQHFYNTSLLDWPFEVTQKKSFNSKTFGTHKIVTDMENVWIFLVNPTYCSCIFYLMLF